MNNIISAPSSPLRARILIPSSKSISNRMLLIRALSSEPGDLQNLSASDDTRIMARILGENRDEKDVGHAGTTMRFLTAFYAVQHGDVVLTGSERMKQRPIGPLVTALRQLGANIDFLEQEGCPPLRIRGGGLRGGRITMDGSVSSQFISALMMIGPRLPGGLDLELSGDLVSVTYLDMTLALMKESGVEGHRDGARIRIPAGAYAPGRHTVEGDWSGASYWFEVAALRPGSRIILPHLKEHSLQGDSVLPRLFAPLGVESRFEDGALELRSSRTRLPEFFEEDFTSCPDLAQTLAATLCGLGVPFRLTGTRTLRVKETDRIAALQAELGKLGFELTSDPGGSFLAWEGRRTEPERDPLMETYHDHRMALALAPMALVTDRIRIRDAGVVSKSYPGYWDDLRTAGFGVEEAPDVLS
ncbi:MAG: 3-phosphoshikimate 1-carboxyvinyltransferase [Bacteroidales bacterium]